MKSIAVAKLKRVRAVELFARGCSYDEIATKVGFSHSGSAHRAVSRALADREAKDVDALRVVEGDRLDAVQAANWDAAMAGDPAASDIVLKAIALRIRLFGLDKHAEPSAAPALLVRPDLKAT